MYEIFIRHMIRLKNILLIISSIIICWILFYMAVSHIYFNPSISQTRGYYFAYKPSQYHLNDKVLICIRDKQQIKILHQLGVPYLSDKCQGDMPYLLKTIVAASGDIIELTGSSGVIINGVLQPNSIGVKQYRRIELNLLQFPPNFRLKATEYFVMGKSKHSYDSRYFGTIRDSDIYYKAILIYKIGNE